MIGKRIFCLIGQLANGGSEKQLYLFLKYIDRTLYTPIVITSHSKSIEIWQPRIENELKITVINLGALRPLLKLLVFRWLVFRYHPSLIFSWSFYTNAFIIAGGKSKFIGSLRGGIEEQRHRLSVLNFKLSLKPKQFVVNSSALVDELHYEGIRRENIALINNNFVSELSAKNKTTLRRHIRKKYCIPAEAIVIAGGGGNSSAKDFLFWLDIFQETLQYEPWLHGFLIGDGPKKIIGNEIDRRGLKDKITLTGEVPYANRLLPAADIFFLSSKTEGFSNILLEAVDADCIILTTNVQGIRDLTADLPEEYKKICILTDRDVHTGSHQLLHLIKSNSRQNLITECQKLLYKFEPKKNMILYYETMNKIINSKTID